MHQSLNVRSQNIPTYRRPERQSRSETVTQRWSETTARRTVWERRRSAQNDHRDLDDDHEAGATAGTSAPEIRQQVNKYSCTSHTGSSFAANLSADCHYRTQVGASATHTAKWSYCLFRGQQQQQQQPFNGLCSGTTRVGRYQKKHSAFCLSIGLCCVQAGFPHLLSSGFLWSRER